MSKKIILVTSIAVLIIFSVIIVLRFSTPEDAWICKNNQWIKHGNPSDPMPESGCGKQNINYGFSKIGNITNFDTTTQMESQSWRFLYEEPGAPAISIFFRPAEECRYYYLSGEIKSCNDAAGEFYNGQRVKMEGEKTDKEFNVARIYEQPSIQIANPASVYCQEQGGKIEIIETAEGQAGQCVFNDGRKCDEWEFFRSHNCSNI